MSEYIVFYKNQGVYYYYNGEEYKTTKTIHQVKMNQFELHHSYDESNEGLKTYYENMKVWSEQIKSKFTKCKFDYLSKYNDMIASVHFCMMYIKKYIQTHDEITFTEQNWIEKCYNTGLQSCKPQDKAIKLYSYDGKGFYQYVLSSEDFLIPDKEGYETTLNELPKRKELKHGFYHVKITSENPNANMVFAFSPEHTYYYYDLYFAMKHKKALDFKIELFQDNEPNAYLYDSLIKSSDIFCKWNTTINELKKEFPENKLLKNLGSKVWGKLVEFNHYIVEGSELDKNFDKYKDCNIIRTKIYGAYEEADYREVHYVQDEAKPYKYNIRLKAQLTSYGRSLVSNYAIENIDNLVRIHTDSMSFTQPWKELDKKIFKKEEKTSGLVQFKKCNDCWHECWKCHTQFKWEQYQNHKCW